MITDVIIPKYFFGALLLGIMYVLWVKPERTVIVKHPTPFNCDSVEHRSAAGECYKYVATKLATCPATGTVKYELTA